MSVASSLFVAVFIYALNTYTAVLNELLFSNRFLSLTVFFSIITGYLILRITGSKHAMGAGVENIVYEYHLPFSKLKITNIVSKFFSTIITIGGGGSGGVQGPSVYFGGYIGGLISDQLGLSYSERKALMLSGIASSLSYIFQAPLGAFFYAIEIPYRRDLETKYIVPVILSSITGYIMSSILLGRSAFMPQIIVSLSTVLEPVNLAVYLLLSLFISALVYLFIYLDRLVERAKQYIAARSELSSVIAFAAVLGAVILFIPQAGGIGYKEFLEIYWDKIYLEAPLLVSVFIIMKMIATSITIRSGASAGYFGPSIFIGGLSGLLFYSVIGRYLSSLPPLVYVYTGIAAFYGAVSTAPIGISVLVTEISGSYSLIFPTILSSFIIRELAGNNVLYKSQRTTRLRSAIEHVLVIAHRAISMEPHIIDDGIDNIIYSKPIPLILGEPLDKAYHIYINSNYAYIPVVNEKNKPIGVIDAKKLVEIKTKHRVITHSIIDALPSIKKNVTIKEVLRLFSKYNVEALLVEDGKSRYAGIITVEDLKKYMLSKIWWLTRSNNN